MTSPQSHGEYLKEVAAKAKAEAPLRLWSMRDVARHAGVQVDTARRWTRKPGFPAPVAVVSGAMRIYDAEEVSRWYTRWVISKRHRKKA